MARVRRLFRRREFGVLLSYYDGVDAALKAWSELRRGGYRRSALIHKAPNRAAQILGAFTVRAYAAAFVLGVSLSLAVGLAFGALLDLRFDSSSAPLMFALVLFGGLLGLLIRHRAGTGVNGSVLAKYARWLVDDESVLIVQVQTRRMSRAYGRLRTVGDVQPSIYAFHPEREVVISGEPLQGEPLPLAKLQEHAEHLGGDHQDFAFQTRGEPLMRRLDECEQLFETVRAELVGASRMDQGVSASAEWLLDNAYLIQKHVDEVRQNLPKRFYHDLPVVEDEQFERTPRVFSLARELVLHTDGRLDRHNIQDFLAAYQTVAPLTIAELWGLPLMLRVALIDSLRQLTESVSLRLREREQADFWASRLLAAARRDPDRLYAILAELTDAAPSPSVYFAFHLVGHLHDEDAALVPVESWLERKLGTTLDSMVLQEQSRQARDQTSIGNAITSLRQLSLLDWREIFEHQSRVEAILRRDPIGVYAHMDFETRDSYRHAVEEISRCARISEQVVAQTALQLAWLHKDKEPRDERRGHIGYYLVEQGRSVLVAQLNCRDTRRKRILDWIYRYPTVLYLGAIASSTIMALAATYTFLYAAKAPRAWVWVMLGATALPASQLAVQAVNYLITRLLPPRTLPKMSYENSGIPDEFRTLIVVPMLTIDENTIRAEIDKLEIRYLANPDQNLVYALFGDYADAPEASMPGDEGLLAAATKAVGALNDRYGEGRFLLLHRDRTWSDTQGCYIGRERKRGKLEQLNRLICGEARDEGIEIVRVGDPDQLVNLRYVITLDSDTQLPHGSARRLVEALAHPLSQPRLCPDGREVEGGYVVIQPRVSTTLPSAVATSFSRLMTDPVGADPYTKAVSDVYQDLAGQGSYHGKGIYDPRAFHSVLKDRFPDETLLSHDLIEGAFVHVGLASDIELFDDFPPNYVAYSNRQHRWIRGDWQIAAWLLPQVPERGGSRAPNRLSGLNRWKIFDNLRRSLVPGASLLMLVTAWTLSPTFGAVASILMALLALFQPLTKVVTGFTTRGALRRFSLRELWHDTLRALAELSLLPHQAGLAIDAILRVWYRGLVSRRDLLQWTTAQMAQDPAAAHSRQLLLQLITASAFAASTSLWVGFVQPDSLIAAAPFLILWVVSPLVGWRLNRREERIKRRHIVPAADRTMLRLVARQTWRFFDEFVGGETSWLPPDNYQVSHRKELAMRTSPTNIGLWLLSVLGAHDFGYLTGDLVIDTLARSFDALKRLETFEGHLLNWYDLRSLEPLPPRYVSAVDSGNLLGSLMTLQQGLESLLDEPVLGRAALRGLHDTLGVLQQALGSRERGYRRTLSDVERLLDASTSTATDLWDTLQQVDRAVEISTGELDADPMLDEHVRYLCGALQDQVRNWIQILNRYLPWLDKAAQMPTQLRQTMGAAQVEAWELALNQVHSLRTLARGESDLAQALEDLRGRPEALQQAAAEWLQGMDKALADAYWFAGEVVGQSEALLADTRMFIDRMNMRFLYDSERRLFRIGYNVDDQSPDNSHYDLLASEARLGSFLAIARGDVPSEHWLSLARPYGSVNGQRVLLSWTGTMFEYLMPLLFQRGYPNSLLSQAAQTSVDVQQAYAQDRGVPWGISESAFGDLDTNKTYQYKAFGVPGLGLKRGLGDDLVVAPYASLLALPLEPGAVVRNLRALDRMGMRSEYGYFEAIDFSRQRNREGQRGIVVRAYMAHHQGMGFLALANYLLDGVMQRRFHADARVKATEPLLYERIPVTAPLNELPGRELAALRTVTSEVAPSVSKFDTAHTDTPKTLLLSNGRYALMLTNAGGGYSRWGEHELTRWRADTTRDHWGTFCYIRDVDDGATWSSAFHPVAGRMDNYTVNFAIDRAEIRRSDRGIETGSEIVVSPEDDAEIRRITLINRSGRRRELDLTSYVELALATHEADRQHPAFNKLFIQTEAIPELNALVATRRPRDLDEDPIWVAHRLTFDPVQNGTFEYETDRRQFVGRGRALSQPAGLEQRLTNSAGQVLDPVFSLRQRVVLQPGEQLRFSMILCAAASRAEVTQLIAKYSENSAIDRAFDLAWTHAQLELRQLRIQPDEARRFQQLASFMLYPSARFRPPGELLRQNELGQSRLWPHGISGDLPLAVVTIGEARNLGLVRQLLQAHTYWRLHGLKADLLILNEESSSYDQPLNEQLKSLIQAHSLHTGIDQPGGIFLRSADQMVPDELTLIYSVARISLIAARGPLPQQLGRSVETGEDPEPLTTRRLAEEPSAPLPFMELPYFNGLGGFTPDGREYAIYLAPNTQTPAPWSNIIANPDFGTLVTESGSGFTWYGNSQQNRLSGWSNDPVSDPPTDVVYIRDEISGVFWTPTASPVRELDAYRARHGAGYTIFEHNSHAIEQELLTFVPMDEGGGEPLRIQRLRLQNDSSRARRLSVTFYVEWTLGDDRERTQQHVITSWDGEVKALMARNRYHPDYGERIAFATVGPAPESFTADRREFLGRNGSHSAPEALKREGLSGRRGAGLDPCAALQVTVELDPGERREIVCLLGQVDSLEEMERLVRKYRERHAVEEAYERTTAWWDNLLGKVGVEIPPASAGFLLNRWLLYQTLSSRIWGRSGFYQSGGAFGFRDQLQDVLALLYAAPEMARDHLLLAASRQFLEGDVQHWWHPPSGVGIRSRISDDLLWLPYAVCQYVRVTGDVDVLHVDIPFLEGRPLEPDEHEIFLEPRVSAERASLFEHCRRAIERAATQGPHGLPLIGIGDWNDGMNRVGVEGKGESVWLAWFLIEVMHGFAELAESLDEHELAAYYQREAGRLAQVVEAEAWDGAWYLRGFYDDGSPLGSSQNDEAKIDSLPQSWALISGAGERERVERALQAAVAELVRPDEGLVLLFSPPFDRSDQNPGYIKGYPPGVRENGGQYTHAALWLAQAVARRGDGDLAGQILRILNPVEQAREPEDVERYAVEPYVVAADVYRLPGKVGRGGWTWYTGSAGWMYRIWLEEILGLQVRHGHLRVQPTIPSDWTSFAIAYRYGRSTYEITVENPAGVSHGVSWVELDGVRSETGTVELVDDRFKHRLRVRMGPPAP